MYQGVTTAWNARTAGQNYMVMNFSSYVVTGGTSTPAAGQFFGSIQNQEGTVLAGIGVRGGDGEVFTWAYKTGGNKQPMREVFRRAERVGESRN